MKNELDAYKALKGAATIVGARKGRDYCTTSYPQSSIGNNSCNHSDCYRVLPPIEYTTTTIYGNRK